MLDEINRRPKKFNKPLDKFSPIPRHFFHPVQIPLKPDPDDTYPTRKQEGICPSQPHYPQMILMYDWLGKHAELWWTGKKDMLDVALHILDASMRELLRLNRKIKKLTK